MSERQRFQSTRPTEEGRQTSSRRAYNLLRQGIREGSLRSGDRLIEEALSVSLATSRNAVREALRMLHDEGLVTRQRRHGTVVAHGLIDVDIKPLLTNQPFAWLPRGLASAQAERIERRLVPTTPYLRQSLETDADEVVMVEDVVRNGAFTTSVRVGYFVQEGDGRLGMWSSEFDRECWWLRLDHSAAFEERFGVGFSHSQTTFEATAADAKSRRLLGLPEGVPILLMKSLLFDCNNRPRELAYFHYAANLITVSVNSIEAVNMETGASREDGKKLPQAS